jgi:hypothetical protein
LKRTVESTFAFFDQHLKPKQEAAASRAPAGGH